MSARQQNFRRQANRFRKVLRDRSKRGQKQIAEAVAFKSRAFVEPVAEELGKQVCVFGQGDDAVADVARRKHVEFFAQPAAGAAVIADRDDGAQFADNRVAGVGLKRFSRGRNETLQSAQESGQAGAAADRDHAQRMSMNGTVPG